ncbi:unnamed protein product [Macrosiphum euphorbiae]|uniref:Uncharacterized protein n=1 Tax=Macrosiphum euphorbiae TaxID=13131 RepID=A0AAV0WVZ2_9HEMI|nr:unnamed protein product [Macrosiphum euphorbiae]
MVKLNFDEARNRSRDERELLAAVYPCQYLHALRGLVLTAVPSVATARVRSAQAGGGRFGGGAVLREMRFPATAVSKMTVRQPSNCDRTHVRVSMQRSCGVWRRARFLLKRKDGGSPAV